MVETALFIIGVLLGVALGYAIRANEYQKKCEGCWSDLYKSAWTLELDGQEIKVIPIYEVGGTDR